MPNVCAVRMQLTGNSHNIGTERGMLVFRHPLPHEPVLFSRQDYDAAVVDLGIGFGELEHRIQAFGSVKLKNGSPYCRHCGSLYAED